MPRVGPTQTPTLEYNKKAEQEFRRDIELNLRGLADGVDGSQHMSDIASAIASKRTVLGIIPIGITTYGSTGAAESLIVGTGSSAAIIASKGTENLVLQTYGVEGTDSGKITIEDAANQNITIDPDGTGITSVTTDLRIEGSDGYLNFDDTTGEGGIGIRNNSGVMEFSESEASWVPITKVGTLSDVGSPYFGKYGHFDLGPIRIIFGIVSEVSNIQTDIIFGEGEGTDTAFATGTGVSNPGCWQVVCVMNGIPGEGEQMAVHISGTNQFSIIGVGFGGSTTKRASYIAIGAAI